MMEFFKIVTVYFIATAFLAAAYGGIRHNDQFQIRELYEMVPSWSDKVRLQILSEDYNTPRSEIQAQINEIVAQQSDDIQEAYHLLLDNQQVLQQQKQQQKLERLQSQNAPQQQITALQQKYEILSNMTLSQAQVNEQLQHLYPNLHH